jgi:hypothetical protein
MRKLMAVAAFALCALPSEALAQEKGKIGVTMGYPAAIGVLWHVTENVAIRPEFDFSWSSSESEFSESDSLGFASGVSALIYTSRGDNLATYFSPRYSFVRSSANRTFEGAQFIEPEIETTTRGHAFTGSMGAQYFLGSRFSVFGELGLSYTRTTQTNDRDDSEPRTSTFGLGSSVGIVLYF